MVAGSAQLLPRQSEDKQLRTKGTKEVTAHVSVRSEPCRRPDGQSNDQDENDEGREGNEAALRPLLFGLAHVGDELSTFFGGFSGFPLRRCTEGNTENDRSEDPEDGEHC